MRRFYWLLILALLVAAFLRVWQIDVLPPGLHYDEAADTIIAQQIARGESAPIFVAAYTGKEVLFFYWAAAWMKLIGPTVFAMRLAAAWTGVLTVAATYRAVRELFASPLSPSSQKARGFPGMGEGAEGVALLTALFIATSFWHVLMSRLGFRSISEPLIQALALAALFRGLRLNRWRWFIIAGVFVGLNLYTYLAARLFPVAIAAIFLYLIVFDRGQRRLRLMQFAGVGLIALSVFAPLGLYFLKNPDAFITRIQQVAPRAEQAQLLLENLLRSLGMFFLSGDPYIRFNLPYRPLFSLVWGVFFGVGLGVALVGMFRGRTVWRRTAYFSIIAVTLIMLLPTALAVNEITPSNLRAIGMMPLVFVFPALGAWWSVKVIWSWISRTHAVQWSRESGLNLLSRYRYVEGILIAVLLIGALETGLIYFRQYVNEPQLYIQTDGDLADIAKVLNETDTRGEPVYVAALHYRHPTVAALSEKYGDIKWIAGSRAVVLPNGPGYLVFSRLGMPDESWLKRFLPDSTLLEAPLAPDGQTNYRVYHLPTQPAIAPQVKLGVNFGNMIQLIGYDVESGGSDGKAGVTLYWRVLNPADRGDYSTFAELKDRWGFEWGKGGSFEYPSEQWMPGEIIVNRVDVPIVAGAPPGDYELRVGIFSQNANQRLNVVAPDGGFGGTVARLMPIPIERAATAASQLNIGTRVDREIVPGLRLLGYSQETSETQTGAPLYFTLFWQSASQLDNEPLAIQLTSCDCANQPKATIALTTTAPVHGTYPFSQWTPGELVADRYGVRVPFDAPPGKYTLEVSAGGSTPIELGSVNVRKGDRVLNEPPVEHRIEKKLGNAIELVGYNLDQTDDAIRLALIWRALKPIDQDYTVFTHVIDQSGKQIAGQDNQPVNGTYPTSHWMPDEYVSDPYEIDLARNPQLSQGYAIEVGMYDPETGGRLGETIRLR